MFTSYIFPHVLAIQDAPPVVNHGTMRFVASGSVDALDGTRVMLVQGARYELETAEPQEGKSSNPGASKWGFPKIWVPKDPNMDGL